MSLRVRQQEALGVREFLLEPGLSRPQGVRLLVQRLPRLLGLAPCLCDLANHRTPQARRGLFSLRERRCTHGAAFQAHAVHEAAAGISDGGNAREHVELKPTHQERHHGHNHERSRKSALGFVRVLGLQWRRCLFSVRVDWRICHRPPLGTAAWLVAAVVVDAGRLQALFGLSDPRWHAMRIVVRWRQHRANPFGTRRHVVTRVSVHW
mmetsp:Transcript_2414/g.7983  ORF Transcript_2414/g.7983 Transcript_2414/m.7983 type:complete len:208 (+) Transcript_2414:379-1002(+)